MVSQPSIHAQTEMLNKETLLELEEISPNDYFYDNESFRKAADSFFQEADFEDIFSHQ